MKYLKKFEYSKYYINKKSNTKNDFIYEPIDINELTSDQIIDKLSQKDIELGDYVVIRYINRNNYLWVDEIPDFHNKYGIIVKIKNGKEKYDESEKYYKIKYLNPELKNQISEFISCSWVFKCESKKEFDILTKKLELENSINKYNL